MKKPAASECSYIMLHARNAEIMERQRSLIIGAAPGWRANSRGIKLSTSGAHIIIIETLSCRVIARLVT